MGRQLNSYTLLLASMAFVLVLFAQQSAHAQGTIDISGQDCDSIVASYAADPKSVPKDVADACQQALSIAPGAGFPADDTLAAQGDPCTGPNAASSVFCFGPWDALLPAAGAAPTVAREDPDTFRLQNCIDTGCPATVVDTNPPPPPPLDLPLGSCEPGLPCGFATVIEGRESVGDPAETSFARFDFDDGGDLSDGVTGFQIDQDGQTIVNSAPVNVALLDRPDEFETLRAQGVDGDQASRLVARVLRQGDDIQYAADVWTDGDQATREIQSGFFAWGTATTAAEIDRLNNTGMGSTLNFQGPMSVDNSTIANLTLAYGADPTWTGSWDNPAYSFSAGGRMQGADFASDPTQFSTNVQSGFVQGALLGPRGDHAVAHIVEVTLDNPGLVRDVGLIRQVQQQVQ